MSEENTKKTENNNDNLNNNQSPVVASPYRCPHCGEINLLPTGLIQYVCTKCGRQNATCDLIFWQ